eukprot:64487_1
MESISINDLELNACIKRNNHQFGGTELIKKMKLKAKLSKSVADNILKSFIASIDNENIMGSLPIKFIFKSIFFRPPNISMLPLPVNIDLRLEEILENQSDSLDLIMNKLRDKCKSTIQNPSIGLEVEFETNDILKSVHKNDNIKKKSRCVILYDGDNQYFVILLEHLILHDNIKIHWCRGEISGKSLLFDAQCTLFNALSLNAQLIIGSNDILCGLYSTKSISLHKIVSKMWNNCPKKLQQIKIQNFELIYKQSRNNEKANKSLTIQANVDAAKLFNVLLDYINLSQIYNNLSVQFDVKKVFLCPNTADNDENQDD